MTSAYPPDLPARIPTPSPTRALRSGFTLIEIIASVLLFSLGAMAVIGVVMYGLSSAMKAQAGATAWATALAVVKDPLPLGAVSASNGTLTPWTWTSSGASWSANDGSADPAWTYTSWPLNLASDVLVPDMADPIANNPAIFSLRGAPAVGCAHGWLNGYYVERREQSRASDRIGRATRIVEVRVDVYWASYGAASDGRRLATVTDRVVRQGDL